MMEPKKKEKYKVKDFVPGSTAMSVITPFGMGTSYSINLILENDETFSMGGIPDYVFRGISHYKMREAEKQQAFKPETEPSEAEEKPEDRLVNRKSIDVIFMEPQFDDVRACMGDLVDEIVIDEGIKTGSGVVFRATAYTKKGEINMVPSSAIYLSIISQSPLYIDRELHEDIKKRNDEMLKKLEEEKKKLEQVQKEQIEKQKEEKKRRENESSSLYT